VGPCQMLLSATLALIFLESLALQLLVHEALSC